MTWKPIPAYPGYEASDSGQIRSTRTVLKPWMSAGYQTVSLRRAGVTKKVHVHRLILLTFVGEPDGQLDGCHIDGDRLNNSIENLYWGTRSQNILDQVTHGRHNNARKTHCLRGHEFTEDNTYVVGAGRRQCKACTLAQSAASYARRRKDTA
jgi:hypothetical protein